MQVLCRASLVVDPREIREGNSRFGNSRFGNQGPVVQSIVSLTSSLVVKLLTVLVSTISNSQVFLMKKCKSYSHFFSNNISIYAIFSDQSFNDKLTNDIVSFEQLGSGLC